MSQTFTDNLSSEKLFVSAAIRQSPKILTLSKGQVLKVQCFPSLGLGGET